MGDAPLALGFTAGLFAVLNPCGFAMLPAYLSFFLVGDVDEATSADTTAGLRRALVVGLSVSAGFAALFAVIGFVVRAVTSRVLEYSPWVSVIIGIALLVFGLALVAGREVRLRLPRLDPGGHAGRPRSMVLYGASYGIVSLGCTLPTFLAYVAGTLTRESFSEGAAVFGAYALGFATLLTALTIAIAVARRSLLTTLRALLPSMQRISGGLLILAGAYVAWYGWHELHRLGEPDPIVDRVTNLSFDLQQIVTNFGAGRIGWILGGAILLTAAWVLLHRRRDRAPSSSSEGRGVRVDVGG